MDPSKNNSLSPVVAVGALLWLCGAGCLSWGKPALGAVLGVLLLGFAGLVLGGKLFPPPARHRVMAVVLSLGMAAWMLALAVLGALSAMKEEEQARADAARAAQVAATQEAALRASIPQRLATARAQLADVPRAVEGLDLVPLHEANTQLAPLRALTPPVPELAELEAELASAYTQVRSAAAEDALTRAETHAQVGEWAAVPPELQRAAGFLGALGPESAPLHARHAALLAESSRHTRRLEVLATANTALAAEHADAVAAEDSYDAALVAIDALDEAAIAGREREVRDTRRRVERARRSNHSRAERLRRQRVEHAARMAVCGEAPTVSAWDGELIGAERIMRSSAHDPDSIDVENCSPPALAVSRNYCWLSTCDVRGRNLFGAMVRNRIQFEARHGLVVGTTR